MWRSARPQRRVSGIAGVLASLAAGGEVARSPSRAASTWGDEASFSRGLGTAASSFAPSPAADLRDMVSPSPAASLAEPSALLRGPSPPAYGSSASSSAAGPPAAVLLRTPEPADRWAEDALAASENVVGCLQIALLRLKNTPAWHIVDSDFARVALPAVVCAAGTQLRAAEERRQGLVSEAGDLKQRVARKEVELAALRQVIESHSWFPRQEHIKVEGCFKEAQERASTLQAKLAVARAELSHLQATMGKDVREEREALQAKRAQIMAIRDELSTECRALRERLACDEDRLQTLSTDASARMHTALQAERQAGLLPGTQSRLEELQGQWTALNMQLQEAKARTKKKKKKGAAKAKRSPAPSPPEAPRPDSPTNGRFTAAKTAALAAEEGQHG